MRRGLFSRTAPLFRQAAAALARLRGRSDDARERTRAEAQEHLLTAIVEKSTDFIAVADLDGRILFVNEAGHRLLNAREGDRLLDIFTDADRRRIQTEVMPCLMKDGRWDGEVRFKGNIPMLWNSFVLDDKISGRPIGIACVSRDIRERKRAEEELRAAALMLEQRVRERTQELERSNADLEQFAYVASHDLQEPLRMVASYVELLKRRYEGKLDADADKYIAYAHDGATRMQRLISDLLTYSQVGRKERRTAVELDRVLALALQNLEQAVAETGAVVTSDPLPVVQGDAGQIGQLVFNLLGNALKFHGEAPPRIHVSSQREGSMVRVSVRDNGIGIEPAFYERIFVVFQRLHGPKKYPGTGIGLALCKKIVERHGGRIWVERAPEGGTIFHFTLPPSAAERAA